MQLNIIGHSKLWLTVSGIILATSIACVAVFGLNEGIDFTGGSLLSVTFPENVAQEAVRATIEHAGFSPTVQEAGDGSMLVRVTPLTETEHQTILAALRSDFGDVTEHEFTSVGPTIGSELKKKAIIAIGLVLLLIAAYVAWAFRRVAEPVASWKYGLITLISAAHDIIIPLGVFAVLGKFFGFEADTAFVAALLTILGYSINDTIVVFDRTRENLYRHRHDDTTFASTVNASIMETLARSLNTTMCVLLPVLAIVIFGGESTRSFSVTLLVGILAGAYSSIFVASPLLVMSEFWGKKK